MEVHTLAYQYASANGKSHPAFWDIRKLARIQNIGSINILQANVAIFYPEKSGIPAKPVQKLFMFHQKL